MKIYLICTALLGISFAYEYETSKFASLSCNCGWRNTGRIIGGSYTKKNEYPWMTAIQYSRSRFQFCGGAIVTQWHIITAAHCTNGKNASDLAVTVGAYDVQNRKEENSQFHRISNIIQHPAYNDITLINDISILVTATEIQFNKFVGPACFPSKRIEDELVGQYFKAMGWGRYIWNMTNSGPEKKLKDIDVQIVPLKKCREYWSHLQYSATQICTFTADKDTCKGDSGGPLTWLDPETNRHTLYGVVSYGAKICGSAKPSVNTNVSAYLDWLNYNISKAKKGLHTCSKH